MNIPRPTPFQIVAVLAFLFHAPALCDAETFHRFRPGELISSDIFNEAFDAIEKYIKGEINTQETLGTWSCFGSEDPGSHITITRNGDAYWLTPSETRFPGDNLLPASFSVTNGMFSIAISDDQNINRGEVRMAGKNFLRFVFHYPWLGAYSCNRISNIPHLPELLTVSLTSEKHVRLTWTDTGDLETGFIVMRAECMEYPEPLSGCMPSEHFTFYELTRTNPNTTSFIDANVDSSKYYWYRVYTYTETETSKGTNIERIFIQ